MKPGSWKQWLKLTKKQLRQIGRTIDQELGNVLERNLPNQAGRMVKIPVAVRHTPNKIPLRTIIYRNFHQYVGASCRNISRFDLSKGGKFISQKAQPVSLFSTSSRVPQGAPRGLYTNWNMSSTRFARQRMYSTASINFTHEAASNIAVSMRCLFNSLDDAIPAGKSTAIDGYCGVNTKLQLPNKLSSRDLSLVRDMEVFEMINDHKEQSLFRGNETYGSYIEFELPKLNLGNVVPSTTFVNSKVLSDFGEEISKSTQRLKLLEQSFRKIHDAYGSLPIMVDKNKNAVMIHFPNLTMEETEALITELGIGLGCVYPYDTGDRCGREIRRGASGEELESILSTNSSVLDFTIDGCAYSPILSEVSFDNGSCVVL